jgi:hypothetical protein
LPELTLLIKTLTGYCSRLPRERKRLEQNAVSSKKREEGARNRGRHRRRCAEAVVAATTIKHCSFSEKIR